MKTLDEFLQEWLGWDETVAINRAKAAFREYLIQEQGNYVKEKEGCSVCNIYIELFAHLLEAAK